MTQIPEQIQLINNDQMMPQINAFLQQKTTDSVNMQNTIDTLVNMMGPVDI